MVQIRCSSKHLSERDYIFTVLFTEILGLSYEIVASPVGHYEIILPNGGTVIVEDHFFEKHTQWLSQENIPQTAAQVPNPFHPLEQLAIIYGQNTFEKTANTYTCGLDLFGSAFFMLTRWEEYVIPEKDAHGRFQAKNALAFKAGFLDRPVVNEYAAFIYDMFAALGYMPLRPTRHYHILFTCDIDHPRLWWSWVGKIKTLVASLLVRQSLTEFKRWWPWIFKKNDPYYVVFEKWLGWAKENNIQCCFNVMGKRSRSSDCYYDIDHPDVKKLILRLHNQGHIIGFHPSYESFDDPNLFEKERQSLQNICPQPIITGRQHYLRFSVPQTWNVWESANMAWDSTVGYAEAEGFRCGICYDFPVYDFVSRKKLSLREKPLIFMDVTMTQYRGYSPEQAAAVWNQLAAQIKKHEGEFVVLWHNSTQDNALIYAK